MTIGQTLHWRDEISGKLEKATRCATKKVQKNSQPKVLENRTNAISGENYVFYGIFYHCGIL